MALKKIAAVSAALLASSIAFGSLTVSANAVEATPMDCYVGWVYSFCVRS